MTWEAWVTVAVIGGVLALLVTERMSSELALLLGMVALLALGILTPSQAVAGFSNEGMITVAAMYVVAAGLRETGAIDLVSRNWLGNGRGIRRAQLKVMLPTAGLSAFINNTPVVATFLPVILSWCKRNKLPASKMLMPLSFAAIFGGTCTLIGTSTNLVVNGLWLSEGGRGLSMFEIAWVGIPCALVGMAYMMFIGGRMLPDHGEEAGLFDNPREYTLEMNVLADGPLVGKSIIEAGLRNLGRLFLVEIERNDQIVPAVNSEERLAANDRLVFAGDVTAIMELQRIKGLEPVRDEPSAIAQQFPERKLVEVVLSPRCPLIGQTLRESRFHTHYGASVVAVARDGKRLRGGLGEMRLRPADTLLLEARPVWVERHRFSPDFLVVSQLADSESPRHHRATAAWVILAAIVTTATVGIFDMLTAALLGAGAMLLLGCVGLSGARKSIDTQVLIVIACSFALGRALQVTGAAEVMASGVLGLAAGQPWVMLAAAYAVTSFMTAIITNNAAAVLMFPIVLAAAESMGVSPVPFIIAVMMAASASFATPLGYQTNLMVAGPGRYRFIDFMRVGLPLNVLLGLVSVAVIPLVWTF
jgi:di/tricarboxylate transporter